MVVFLIRVIVCCFLLFLWLWDTYRMLKNALIWTFGVLAMLKQRTILPIENG